VQGFVVKRAVMPKLVWRTAALHYDSVRLVVGPSQLSDIARKSRDEHDRHIRLPACLSSRSHQYPTPVGIAAPAACNCEYSLIFGSGSIRSRRH
jgi:hypothetical protein